MRERILVTGGAGCIGSDLAEALVRLDHDVTVLDNLSSGKREHLEPLLGRGNFRFVEGDLLDADLVKEVVRDQDMVYHLAANPDVKYLPGDATDRDLQQNVLCTYNVLEAMRLCGIRRLAFSSSSAVYGLSDRQPIPEDQPMRPISLYGATKLACEGMISAFGHLFGIRWWIFRFANIVGAKVRKRGGTVIGDFVEKLRLDPSRLEILGNGRQEKSYLRSQECIEGMLFAVASAPPDTYNLGGDDSLPVTAIAQMVVEALNLEKVEFHFTGGDGGWLGDVPRFRLDPGRINRAGWRATHSSREAVQMAIHSVVEQAICRQ